MWSLRSITGVLAANALIFTDYSIGHCSRRGQSSHTTVEGGVPKQKTNTAVEKSGVTLIDVSRWEQHCRSEVGRNHDGCVRVGTIGG